MSKNKKTAAVPTAAPVVTATTAEIPAKVELTAEEKVAAIQAAEAHRLAQEEADRVFALSQVKLAADVADALGEESLGAMTDALAVGNAAWTYFNAGLLHETGSKANRFTACVKALKETLGGMVPNGRDINISRYLGYAALSRVWSAEKMVRLGRSIVDSALPLLARDDSAPALEYQADGTAGPVVTYAYSFVPEWKEESVKLLESAVAGAGTCKAMTLSEFLKAKKAFAQTAKGRGKAKGEKEVSAPVVPVEVSDSAKRIGRALAAAASPVVATESGKTAEVNRAAAVAVAVQQGDFGLADILSSIAAFGAATTIETKARLEGLRAIRSAANDAVEGIKTAGLAAKAARAEKRAAKETAAAATVPTVEAVAA
jgi:hypothetical protein